MPIRKFRRIDDMPELWCETGDPSIPRRLQTVCRIGAALAGPLHMPRGVRKFRSLEAMKAERDRYQAARIERIRRSRGE
ncbi:MAG TPA: hypothetical protein VF111_08640 [Thermoanaerobaculia bacterium]